MFHVFSYVFLRSNHDFEVCSAEEFLITSFQSHLETLLKLLTVRILKPGCLEEDCPVITFSEKKRFSIFFLQKDR